MRGDSGPPKKQKRPARKRRPLVLRPPSHRSGAAAVDLSHGPRAVCPGRSRRNGVPRANGSSAQTPDDWLDGLRAL
jgi:hypothetical protein